MVPRIARPIEAPRLPMNCAREDATPIFSLGTAYWMAITTLANVSPAPSPVAADRQLRSRNDELWLMLVRR